MTIHHDKLAYGKLAPNMQELSEDEISRMLKLLNEQAEEGEQPSEEDKNGKKNIIKKL